MTKLLLSACLVTVWAVPGFAAPPFTCKASGDTWSIAGSPERKATCALRCVLRDTAGNQDVVTCQPTVAPGTRADPVCEGFLLGKHWTTATLVAAECAHVEP